MSNRNTVIHCTQSNPSLPSSSMAGANLDDLADVVPKKGGTTKKNTCLDGMSFDFSHESINMPCESSIERESSVENLLLNLAVASSGAKP